MSAPASLARITVTQICNELAALKEVDLSNDEVTRRKLLLHQGPARCLDRFAIRFLCSLHDLFVKEEMMDKAEGGVVGVSWYTIAPHITAGHFDIAPGHWLFEISTQVGAALIRSLPSCKTRIPALSGPATFTPDMIVLPGQTVQSVSWITKLSERENGQITGWAKTVVSIGNKIAMRSMFEFILLSPEEFDRGVALVQKLVERYARRPDPSHRVVA